MSDPTAAAAMMLFSPQGRANPYPIYATLRDAAAVLKTRSGAAW